MLGKKIRERIKIQRQNNKNLDAMLTISINRIVMQKSGCFIPGLGVSFINYNNQTRDPIGHLLGYTDLRGFWGLISSETQKPLVAKIRAKYRINISFSSENDRLVSFLQALQDAHDIAFDEFNNLINKNCNRMDIFIANCVKIKKEFRL